MRTLIAEDDATTLHALTRCLQDWGYQVQGAADGTAAWEILRRDDAPSLALLDWIMPGVSGVDLCRQARALRPREPLYLILLTIRAEKPDVVEGLEAGADDFITKPFHPDELRARLRVWERVLRLERELVERVRELERASAQLDQVHGLLPICTYCKKIRDDRNYWHSVENYLATHADLDVSHGVCPECMEKTVRPMLADLKKKAA